MTTIFTWNVLHHEFVVGERDYEEGAGGHREARWRRTLDYVFAPRGGAPPTLVGLQETSVAFAEFLLGYLHEKKLEYVVYYAGTDVPLDASPGFVKPSAGWTDRRYRYGNVSMVRSDAVDVAPEFHFSPFENTGCGNHNNAVLTRVLIGGHRVVWVNTHITPSSFHQCEQLGTIGHNLGVLRTGQWADAEVVFSGDFNGVVAKHMEEHTKLKSLHRALPQGTNTFSTRGGQPPMERVVHERCGGYDNVYVTPGMRLRSVCVGGELNTEGEELHCCDPYPTHNVRCQNGDMSDHYPVSADLLF